MDQYYIRHAIVSLSTPNLTLMRELKLILLIVFYVLLNVPLLPSTN